MYKRILLLPLIGLFIRLSVSILSAQDAPATAGSDIDPDMIKENIKKRIEQVIRDQTADKPQKKVAYLGTISSITPNSITLETNDGEIAQASTSANTIYIATPTNKQVKREDASIGDFIAALGFRPLEVEVLDTRRLLILGDPPESSPKTSFFGTVTSIDTKKNRFELTSLSDNQTKLFSVTTKTQILVSDPQQLTPDEIDLEELNLRQTAMVIFLPAAASTSASPVDTMLIKSVNQNNAATN